MLFAAGDSFAGGGASLISVVYLVFLTDVVGLNPALAGTAVLVAKLWDAVNDPLTGALSDRTRTRMGRRRPYILVGSLLLVFGMALLWLPDGPAVTQVQKMAWAMGTYIVYSTIQTSIAVPYASLSTEITTDPRLRNQVNVLRLAFSTVSSAAVSLLASELMSRYRRGEVGVETVYGVIVLGFGGVWALLMLGVALVARERVPLPTTPAPPVLRGFLTPLREPSFRVLLGMYLCQAITFDIISATVLYYGAYVVGGISSTVFLAMFIVVQLAAFPVIGRLVQRVDKHRIYRTLLPLGLLGLVAVALYPASGPPVAVYATALLLAFGLVGAQLTPWVMFPDVLDAAELRTGRRDAGSFGGLMTFTRGVATALTIQGIGLVLHLTGYVAPAGAVVAQQPAATVWGIRMVLLVGPALLLTTGWLISRRYPLTQAACRHQQDELERRRTL